MAAVPKRAQNYIPISKQTKNRMKFAEEPRRINTKQGNLSYIEDRRIQKMPASSPRRIQADGYYAAARPQPKKPAPRPVYPRNMQGARVSPQGGISIPLPQTKPQKQPRQEIKTAARPASVGVVSTILLIAAVFGILSFLLIRNATITNLSLGNAAIQDRIDDLSQEVDQLKLDVTLNEDLGAIQDRAAELNMATPGSDQITYLPEDTTTLNTAAASTMAEQDTQEPSLNEQSFSLNTIFKTIKSWLE